MNVKPLKNYSVPTYPSRIEVLSDSALLEKHTPPAWRKTAQLVSLTAFFLSVNGCVSSQKATVVAPIFEHGEGRGALGCVVIAPPTFLSEEEALQIIEEELAQVGVEFTQREVVFERVKIRQQKEINVKDATKVVNLSKIPFHCDLLDENRRIAIEFVSHDDYFELGGVKDEATSVQKYLLKETAQKLSEKVKQKCENMTFGSFYDPSIRRSKEKSEKYFQEFEEKNSALLKTDRNNIVQNTKELRKEYEDKFKELREQTKLESKRLLRLQVKDFTEWLKGQGVI